MKSEAVEWHRKLQEEKKQCRFYPGCTNKPKGATITDGKKYKVCLSCAKKWLKEHPETELSFEK